MAVRQQASESSEPSFRGRAGQTRQVPAHLSCSCGVTSTISVTRVVDVAADPVLGARARAGTLGEVQCPRCETAHVLDLAFIYHDPEKRIFLLCLPAGARHREAEERAAVWTDLAADRGHALTRYVREFEVAFGVAELTAKLAPLSASRPSHIAIKMPEPVTQIANVTVPLRLSALAESAEFSPVPAPPELSAEPTHVTCAPDDDTLAPNERHRFTVVDGRVRLLARASAATLAALATTRPSLTVQTFVEGPRPLFVVSVSPGPLASARPEDIVAASLDLGRADDARVLEALAARCAVRVMLLGDAGARLIEIDAPLEDNLQLGLRLAAERFEAGVNGTFNDAEQAYSAPGFDRTGKRAASLAADSFAQLQAPTEVLLALDVVAHWSELASERYLLLERALPATWWRTCRRHVVERAIVIGLMLPMSLVPVAVTEGLAKSRKDLASRLVRGFIASCDGNVALDGTRRVENWRALVAEAEAAGVALPVRATELAGLASPTSSTETVAIVQIEPADGESTNRSVIQASEPELIALLDDKNLRGAAAVELARRGTESAIVPVFRALGRMTRGDAIRVLPQLATFGAAAVPQLIDSLRSKKGFVRHGAALSLALLKHPQGREPLCAQLVDEPTELWREMARAIGALGAVAVPIIAARVRETAIDRHERLSWALAHLAAHEARPEVEALAHGRDRMVGDVARTAIELVATAQKSDAEVRGRAPAPDQTVNRAFSRSFFDAVAGREDDAAPRLSPRASTLRLAGPGLGPDGQPLIGSPGPAGHHPRQPDHHDDEEEILDDADLLPG